MDALVAARQTQMIVFILIKNLLLCWRCFVVGLTASVSLHSIPDSSFYSHPEPWVSFLNFHREFTERDFLKFNIPEFRNEHLKIRVMNAENYEVTWSVNYKRCKVI